jgi:flagellar hook-associated protein 3 FlgL
MRITDQMIYNRSIVDISSQRSRLFNLQTQAATGQKFQEIEEDPVSARRLRMLKEAKESALHYKKNIDRSRTQLEMADTALEEATNIVIRAKEIALAMSNEVVSPEQRQIVAEEARSLYDSMLNVANTQSAGEFIFAGYETKTEPFLPNGTYAGDSNLKKVDVGPSSRLEVGVSGENAFTAAGGIDVFNELNNLINALETDDDAGIQAIVDTMDLALDQISRERTKSGLKINQLDVASNVRKTLEDSLTKETSSVIDIDPVEVFLELSETSKALQEALSVAQKVTSNSLLTSIG